MAPIGSLMIETLLTATLLLNTPAEDPVQTDGGDRLFGRVVTTSGDVFEGYIRWDRNEGSWADILHGTKELPLGNMVEAEELGAPEHRARNELRFLGLKVSWDDEEGWPEEASSGIRFGHLRSLEVIDDDRALLVLKSGEELVLESGSTDVGDDVRGIVVEDAARGDVELEWRDLELIDFSAATTATPTADRLYGTLRTAWGEEFTGFVAWDMDEILTSDVLDGEERGRDREIQFGSIQAIEQDGRSGARVVLMGGEEIRLRGTNDVNDDNRGIVISDPGLGQVTVRWEEFEDLVFEPAPSPVGYDEYDGGKSLYGTVETRDGSTLTGFVRWDNDEEYSWEFLDGYYRDIELDVEFSQIDTIERATSRSSDVTLLDGRTFELGGSNDVDEDNKGLVVVTDDGKAEWVDWGDFRRVRFAR